MEQHIPLNKILPNPEQPRREFDPTELAGLAESLRTTEQILNITVEETADGFYILHDGERRTRAARLAGWTHIRATVLPINHSGSVERLVRALVANVQRSDLNPIDEGNAYAKMIAAGMSIQEIARRTGMYHNRIANRLTLTNLSLPIQQMIVERRLPADARIAAAILTLPEFAQIPFAEKMASRPGLTIKAILNACARLAQTLAAQASAAQPDHDHNAAPGDAVTPPFHRTRIASQPPTGWNALSQLGKTPPWLTIENAAAAVCRDCALADVAGPTTCAECPLVSFLRRLMEK